MKMVYQHPTAHLDEGDLSDGYRVCISCTRRKHITEFHWTGKKTGRRRQCKNCLVEKAKAHRNLNREQYRRYSLKWHLNSTYDMTLEEYDRLLTNQNESCKICGNRFDLTDQNRRPHIDHSHKTGKIRGILCFKCNTALGKFNDDSDLLRTAAWYLDTYG